ncbi:TetR/AcrR family transcriptional regulator [Flavobacterium sp. UMI-01]|uniref:TetR/AcrR family transcriptional regulator n=1 Tax=Flavobacterium sp. UMI-01 TaxID=1441053 RepID=UPI001C7D85A5|nr:TetR/AcrR family transcriptional regulator [Flavobacterium sp. UMI-01]GIZ07575.1 hypothetical protein FUMI01_03020 [Flavobacterium sp. UMI-01]
MKSNSENRILKNATHLFFAYGIQRITMDDIATKTGVSKKTIYKYFENKDELLQQIITLQLAKFQDVLLKNNKECENALVELIYFFEYINQLAFKISASFGKELKKYHTAVFIIEIKNINTHVMAFLLNNISRGKQEGVYKSDLNIVEISESFTEFSKKLFFNGFLSNSITNNKQTITFLNSLFLHRLVSIKGLDLLNDYNKS